MMEKKFAIIRTVGNEESLLKSFPADKKEEALKYGETVAKDNKEGVISCVFASFSEDGKMATDSYRVFEVWDGKDHSLNLLLAYKDKDSSEFDSLPLILDGFNNLPELLKKKRSMIEEGYKDVVCFRVKEDCPEEITWGYVLEHKLNI